MTDQQLIESTAAAIADDLMREGTHVTIKDRHSRPVVPVSRTDLMRLVASHLQWMLAERAEAATLPTNEELAS